MNERHPNLEQIVGLVESGSDPGDRIGDHLKGCTGCAERARQIRSLLATFHGARRMAEPSEPAIRNVLEAIREALGESVDYAEDAAGPSSAKALSRPMEKLREVWAVLVADSLVPNAAVRGTTDAVPKMLLYETDAFSITLSLKPGSSADAIDLSGQVAPRSTGSLPEGSRAVLRRGERAQEAQLSKFGEFEFLDQEEAVTDLSVVLGDTLVRLRLP
jgi:hypothetical protein